MKKLLTITIIFLLTTTFSFAKMCQPKKDFSNTNPCPKAKKEKFVKTKNYTDQVRGNEAAEKAEIKDSGVRRGVDNYKGPSKAQSKNGGQSSSYKR